MTAIVEQRVLSVFDLVEEPRDELYRRLIVWCGEHCATALLVIRDVDDLSEESANILKRLEDNLTTVERSSQWPGTVLVSSNETALVYRYRLTPQTVELFCTLVDGLYEWAEPNRPDDLCFTRADGSPMLVTIAHERDAYLQLLPDEVRSVREALPTLAIARR